MTYYFGRKSVRFPTTVTPVRVTHTMTVLSLLSALAGLPTGAAAQSTQPATTQAARAANGWDGSWFRYDRPTDGWVVEETTPSADQVNFYRRPPQLDDPKEDLVAATAKAKPVAVGPVNIVRLRFKDNVGEVVTALLCTPKGKSGPFPLVVAVHGLTSNKAQVCGQVAPTLAKLGFAVLAPDMPLHGERPGNPHEIFNQKDLLGTARRYRQAVMNVRQCIDVAEARPELDLSRGVILAGYSMGSWINSVVGPADPRVAAAVLMVGGARDLHPAAMLVPQIAACDPRLAMANFGRPLLMLNAKRDPTVTPEMGRRLFAAASEPKEQRWYDCGHRLTEDAYEDAAAWARQTWDALPLLGEAPRD